MHVDVRCARELCSARLIHLTHADGMTAIYVKAKGQKGLRLLINWRWESQRIKIGFKLR